VRALAWSPNGETLASANWNLRTVRLWDVQSGELRRSLQWDEHFVYFLAWFPDGKTLASANFGHTWRLWDPESGQLRRLVLALDNLPALALSPDGHYRGAGDVNEELVYIVQTEDGQETLTPEEFASKYGWKNDPMRVGPGDD
jgi:WD40 repeat protein